MDTKLPPGSPHTSQPLARALLQVGGIVVGALILWLVGFESFRSGAPHPQAPVPGTSAPTAVLAPTEVAPDPPFATLVDTTPPSSTLPVWIPTSQSEIDVSLDGPESGSPNENLDQSAESVQDAPVRVSPEAASPVAEGEVPSTREEPSLLPDPCTTGAPDAASECAEVNAAQEEMAQLPGAFGGGALPLEASVGETAGEVTPFDSPLAQPQGKDVSVEGTASVVTPFDSPLVQPPGDIKIAAIPATEGDWVWPIRGVISQGYSSAHRAIDIDAVQGSVVRAVDAGRVVYAKWESSGYGYLVIVDHTNGYVSYYAHLYGFYVDIGQTVARGEQIGELGNTGDSTGPHLHFEIRYDGVQHNPLDLLPDS